MDPFSIALLAAQLGLKGYQWWRGQQIAEKPTPFKPDWSGGDYAKLRADWEKGLQSQLATARGAETARITETMAGRNILSSGITAGAGVEMEPKLSQLAIQERSAFETELRDKYMKHKQLWEAAERSRLLAKDTLTQELLGDILSELGITGMERFQGSKWAKSLWGKGG